MPLHRQLLTLLLVIWTIALALAGPKPAKKDTLTMRRENETPREAIDIGNRLIEGFARP